MEERTRHGREVISNTAVRGKNEKKSLLNRQGPLDIPSNQLEGFGEKGRRLEKEKTGLRRKIRRDT